MAGTRTKTEEKTPDAGTPDAATPDAATPDAATPDAATGNGQGPAPEGTTEEKKAPARKKAPDTSKIKLDDIDAVALAPVELVKAATPIRARSDEQVKMDAVAQRVYDKWVKDGKPTLWQNMPVVTYFLDEGEELEGYKYQIKNAAKVVKNAAGEPDVARIRFGNEFTVTEEMAGRLRNPDGSVGRPEVAGKTVLAWSVLDKRGEKSPATQAAEKREAREGANK
jgi:hypothetical protein